MGMFAQGAMKQRIRNSHIPPCHRHMVIATNLSVQGGWGVLEDVALQGANAAESLLFMWETKNTCLLVLRVVRQTFQLQAISQSETGRKEIILRSSSPWGFYPF